MEGYLTHQIVTRILIAFPLLVLIACDPERFPAGTFYVEVQGSLNKTDKTIQLGDTISFEVILPQTVTARNAIGDIKQETVSSLQEAFYGFDIWRMDTINRTVYSGTNKKVNYFLSPGSFPPYHCPQCPGGHPRLRTNVKPYMCILYLIPEVKGIFYLQIEKQAGNLRFNNNFAGRLSVTIDINESHLDLVDQYIPGFASAINQSGSQKYFYCFKVE